MQPQQPAGFGAGSLAQFGQPHAEFQQAVQASQQRWGQPQGFGAQAPGFGAAGMGQPGTAAFGAGYGQAGVGSLAQFGQPHAEQHWYHPQQQNYQQFQQAMQASQQRWGQPQGFGAQAPGFGTAGMGQPGTAAFGASYGQPGAGAITGPAQQMFQPLPGEQHPQQQNYQQFQQAMQGAPQRWGQPQGFGAQAPGFGIAGMGQPGTAAFGAGYGQPQRPGSVPGYGAPGFPTR